MKALVRKLLAAAWLGLLAAPALAANYAFPGSMPAGCTGSGGNYVCGALSLAYNDTITIGGTKPATIRINGNFNTNNAQINTTGTASDLTITVTGTLATAYQAQINAHISAGSVDDSNGGRVTFGGNLTATTGAITLDYASSVTGNVTGSSGDIDLGGTVQVGGSISCSCAVTLGYTARVVGAISAASVVGNGQVFLNSTLTTTGSVDVGYASTLGGAVTAGGSIRLRGNTQTNACLRSTSSSAITLAWDDRANGGVCCGSLGSCGTGCVNNGSGAAMPTTCAGAPPPATPARFNAFETSTAATAITGVIKTKIAGSPFSVAVVAVNSAGNGVATTFTGNVKVEVLDGSDNSGALNATTNCRSSWTVASGTGSSTLTFAAADLGRKNITLTVAEAFRDARLRISYPDTGTATVIGCSTDDFAIRPASLGNLSVTDATSSSAGTGRSLVNTASTGGVVHKAGQPFTVQATAVNGAGATTTLYNGTPTPTLSACGGAACSATPGTLTLGATASGGVINASNASYSEAGAFDLTLVDTSFAAVDVSDGSTAAERTVSSSTLSVGRFVPDHFDLVNLVTPVLRTFNSSSCTSRSFTYLGQPFGYATRPQATVLARNAAGATTVNYPNAKLNALSVTQTYTPSAAATPGLDSSNTAVPSLSGNGNGTATLTAQSTDTLTLVRSSTTPAAPFNAVINLSWSVADGSESGVSGNGSIATATALAYNGIGFDSGSEFRFGLLKLSNAYGSELVNLAVPIELQYWNGTLFVTNAVDQCTSLPTASVALANFRGSLAACETAPGSGTVGFSSGRGVLRMAAPGNGNSGSVDLTVNLGASASGNRCSAVGAATSAATAANLPWLQPRTAAVSTYNQNPSARVSFGQYRSPLIHQRELY
jgi:MSHA biogenesis protein MshQ